MTKNINTKQDQLKRNSKNIYKKNEKEYIFCTNLDINKFKNLESDKNNTKYFFNKFIVRENKQNKKIYLGKIEVTTNELNYINEIKELKPKYHKSIVEEYINSVEEYCNELNFLVDKIEAITSYRLVVGLGNSSVTETSMTLHNIYGIPYIPGQALKGIVRSYFLQKYFNIEKKEFDNVRINNKNINSQKLYRFIFGDDINKEDNQKGNIIFFDSFPISEEISIEKDVMTPHYKEYYKNNYNPTDTFNPTPIPFYTIKDTKFKFMFALSKNKFKISEEQYIDIEYLKEFVLNLLQEALKEHGVGAKTAVGYGYFNVDKGDIGTKE